MTVFEGVKKLTPYAVAVALCAIALSVVLELWRADLNVPFQNTGDAIAAQAFVKTLLEKGVYYQTDRAGAPFGMELRDYPLPESLTFAELRVLSWLGRTTNPIRVINYFFLLTFFLTTLSALFVLRHFKIATAPALAASVLYAFVPYHFFRGVSHLFLTAYYLIPLTVMVVLWLYLGRLNAPWSRKRTEATGGGEPLSRSDRLAPLAVRRALVPADFVGWSVLRLLRLFFLHRGGAGLRDAASGALGRWSPAERSWRLFRAAWL